MSRGAQAEALAALAAYLAVRQADKKAHQFAADIHFRFGLRDKGFAHALRAFELDPADVHYGLDCAYNLLRAGRRSDALKIADILSACTLDDANQCDTLGTIFTHAQLPARALPHFERACELAGNSPQLLFNLSSAQRMLGRHEDAEASLDRVLRLAPGHGIAHLARSQLRRQTIERNHVAELDAALAQCTSVEHQVHAGYALAKELEDIGQYQRSFAALSAASRLQRSLVKYDAEVEVRMMQAMGHLQVTPSAREDSKSVPRGGQPIFVVGLPRSGTTLVERIVCSIPGVGSAGEANVLGGLVWRMASGEGRPRDPVAAVLDVVRHSSARIAADYASELGARFDGPFVDKTPGNALFAAVIRNAFPAARIVCLRRNAMDSCYAMYKQLFSGGYPYSYELGELADYYLEWHRMVSRWEQELGETWLTVRYEELVTNPEPNMRRIIKHCGLTWDDACLRFHDLGTPVTSASAGQVSRPLYTDSIGSWRRYSHELLGLEARLRDAGIPVETNE